MMLELRRFARAAILLLALAACRAGTGGASTPSTASPTSTPAASVTAEATPSISQPPSSEPTASPSGSAQPAAFDVAPNAAADALFLDRDDCENRVDGYRVEFPDAWYTNTAVGDFEPCQWFSPAFYEVADASEVPLEIAITIDLVDGDVGTVNEIVSRDEGLVGGTQTAMRWEERGAGTEGSEFPPSWRSYVYVVHLGPTPEAGPNLLIRTATDMGGDYELNKAVMDRMIATMELIGTIQ
jgi:hypothetical protein